ncbi:ABC transporter ATP-binding protein [Aeromicrobium camelliae]|uniref:ABC transporter ATP-binding protein n=1 Tax=Aeromicrobium camelliae TaxID=1538144 RepID=A0A3N6WUV6_9ACTN|nr:ABC transporter ATP-binding protein [Aeromicrobium camelliae]RQN08782.1 ABC transporter ATP-binding protein [Aeromicrobium camelliae]
MTMIEVRGLRKTFGDVVAVDDISLSVEEGEILGVLGPNGAGKTTTVESIAGLVRPDTGTVRVAGLDPLTRRRELTRVLGVQLQEAALQDKITVAEALDLYAAFYERPADGRELAEGLGLGSKLDTRFAKLSGGQKQRLSIALALIGRPRVALLDELTTGLDPQSRRNVWELVERVRADGTTIVLVTHFMEEAERLCDRLALIAGGRVVAIDTPAGLISSTEAPTVMSFRPDGPVDLARLTAIDGVADAREQGAGIELRATDGAVIEVLDRLRADGVRFTQLRVVESSLDDAYVRLVGATREESEEVSA